MKLFFFVLLVFLCLGSSAQNVGIGTNTPASRLHIINNEMSVPLRIQNMLPGGYTGIHFHNAPGNLMGHIGFGNENAPTLSNSFYAGSIANVPFVLTSNDQERMRITASGNVGISINNPASRLHVNGTSWFQGNNTPLPSSAGTGIGIGYSAGETGGYIFAFDYASYTPRDIWLQSTGGSVLINTTTPVPAARLQVSGDDKTAVYAYSATQQAFYGATSSAYDAIYGHSLIGSGVHGVSGSSSGTGVVGEGNYGVFGGAAGVNPSRAAIYGNLNTGSPGGYAGLFYGNVTVNGILAKSGGAFLIDHPTEPETKFLYHSFVESPDMKNIYDGITTTGIDGLATITLPSWFQALNMDFRYQLTCIGSFAQAIIEKEISENRFVIKTDKPGIKVSWQVTGIRHDPFAVDNRIPVEKNKKATEIGKYMYPKGYGKSDEYYIDEFKNVDPPAKKQPKKEKDF